MTKVVALEAGHDGVTYRNRGDEFDLDLEDARYKGATWFTPVKTIAPPQAAEQSAKPAKAPKAKPPVDDDIA